MKTLLITAFIAISGLSFGQIQRVERPKTERIGKIKPFGKFWIESTRDGNRYTFTYRDRKFRHIGDYKHFSFADVDGAFDRLYEMIMDGFSKKHKKGEQSTLLEIPVGYLWLTFRTNLGITRFSFGHGLGKNGYALGFSPWLTKKQVMKLFGKKK